MAASVLQQSSNQLLNWNHFLVVSPPSGFLNVGSALNGALTTIGNLFMGLGTFIWSVVSWLFQIALNPSFIMDPLFKDMANVYKFAYQAFFLPLLPLLAAAALLYLIYFYFRGKHAQMARVFASSALAVLIVLVGFFEFPVLFQIADTLAIGTTSAVMGMLESTLSGGQVTASNQAIGGLTNTYLQEPWQLMQFGFISSNPSQYGLYGGVTGTMFSTLASNLNQVDPSVTSAVLQEQFSTAYPNLITVANPQATAGSGLPSTMTVQGLATDVNGALVPDWRNVFYVYGGQNQESAIAKSFFVQGQQTVVGAANPSNTSGNLDENHFFNGTGNLVLIILAMITSCIPLAFALFTGAQLLWRELNFFFKLGQGIISLPFLMVPEAGPAHTKKWLGQAAGHLIERFGIGVYFAIAVGVGSLLEQVVTGLIVGNAELGMMISMLFLAFWYLSAFIYREKLFSMTVHPLAATVAQNSGIAGRGYARGLQQADERKQAIMEATKKERERREEERKHPKGTSQKRAKTIRPFQREQKATQPSSERKGGRAPKQYSGGNVPLSQEDWEKELAAMHTHDPVLQSISRDKERFDVGSAPVAAEASVHIEERRNDRGASSVIRYADAVTWAKGAGMLTHLSMKRGLGASDAQVSALMGQMSKDGVIRRDGHGFWRAAVPTNDEQVPDTAATNPLQDDTSTKDEASLNQGEAQPESAASMSNAEMHREGADSYNQAVSWVQGHGAATPFVLARRLGVEESAATTLLGRMQENGVVQRGVGQWWKAIPANSDEPERGAETVNAGGESIISTPDVSGNDLEELRVEKRSPIAEPLETIHHEASKGLEEPNRITPPQQVASSIDAQRASVSRQAIRPPGNAGVGNRATMQTPPATPSVVTNQQVGRLKQFTRAVGNTTVVAARSAPVQIAAEAAHVGVRVTKGTAKLAFKGGAATTMAAIRAMEWHSDRIGTPPGNETFTQEFKRRMLRPSRLEQRVGMATKTTRNVGGVAARGAKAAARQLNRMPTGRQSRETVRVTGETVRNKAKGMAKDWFRG